MARRKRLVNKEALKRGAVKCKFCTCDVYELLDVHRILEGKDGGTYEQTLTHGNCVVLCANCHRMVHAGIIKIDRWYTTTMGKMVLHFWKDGTEFWE